MSWIELVSFYFKCNGLHNNKFGKQNNLNIILTQYKKKSNIKNKTLKKKKNNPRSLQTQHFFSLVFVKCVQIDLNN